MRRTFMGSAGPALVLAAILVTGCGASSSSSSTTTTSKATTASTSTVPRAAPAPDAGRAAYIAQADAICQQARAQVEPELRRLAPARDTPQGFLLAATAVRRVQAVQQAALKRLQALKPPAASSTPANAYLAQGTQVLAGLGRLADAFARQNRAAIARAEADATRTASVARAAAQGYGFKVCGTGAGGDGLA